MSSCQRGSTSETVETSTHRNCMGAPQLSQFGGRTFFASAVLRTPGRSTVVVRFRDTADHSLLVGYVLPACGNTPHGTGG
jgi:hypothetical protein